MGIEETAILLIAGGIASILQHAQTLAQAAGWTIPPNWKKVAAAMLAFVAASIVILVGEQNGIDLSSSSPQDWVTAFLVAFAGSQTIFALVLPLLGNPSKS